MKIFHFVVTLLIATEIYGVIGLSEEDLESSIYTDPGKYYAKSNQKNQQRRRLKKKKNHGSRIRGSSSSNTSSQKSRLKYAFLQPQDSSSISKDGEECHEPNGVFNAFTFMNFALAGATLGPCKNYYPLTL